MKSINWKVRFKNKIFWMTIIPSLFLLVQLVLSLFGITVDFAEVQGKVLAIVDVVFAILATLGVVTDQTTHGIGDSLQALNYEKPKKDGE